MTVTKIRTIGLGAVLLIGLAACAAPPNDQDRAYETRAPQGLPQGTAAPSAEGDGAAGEEGIISGTEEGREWNERTSLSELSGAENFEAILQERSREGDQEALKILRERYEIVTPQDLPTRKTEANVVAYALASTNPVGEKVFSRNPLDRLSAKSRCRRYASQDEAQAVFLDAGGPEQDTLGLDPDGDGYACEWTPEAYKTLLNATQ